MFTLKAWLVLILAHTVCFRYGFCYCSTKRTLFSIRESFRLHYLKETTIKEANTKTLKRIPFLPPSKPNTLPESSLSNFGKIIINLKQTILSKHKHRKPWTESLLHLRKTILGEVKDSTQYAGESLMSKLDRIHELQSTEIANAMWLLGFLANKLPVMNIKPTTSIADEMISVFCKRCGHSIKRGLALSNNEISSFLIGLGRLGLTFDHLSSSQHLITLLETTINSFSDDDLSSMIHSLGKVKVDQRKHLPVSFKNALYSRLSEIIPSANARALSSALWGLNKCKFNWDDFPCDVKHNVIAAVSSLDGSESRQATANIFLSLGQMGFQFSGLSPAQAIIFQTHLQKLPKRMMKLQDMIQIFHGLGCMQCCWESFLPSAQFALAESWYLAIQSHLTQDGKNNRFKDMKSIPVIDPVGTGIVLNQLAEMGAEWRTLPVPLKAGLMLCLVYADNSSVVIQNKDKNVQFSSNYKAAMINSQFVTIDNAKNSEHIAGLDDSSYIVMELQRLEEVFRRRNSGHQDTAEQQALEQQYLSKRQEYKAKTKPFNGFARNSVKKASNKQEEISFQVVARSIATIVHSLSRMKVSFHDIHPQARECLFRLLLRCEPTRDIYHQQSDICHDNNGIRNRQLLQGRSLSLLLTGMADMFVSWTKDLPTEIQDLLWYAVISLPLNDKHRTVYAVDKDHDKSRLEKLSKHSSGVNDDSLIQVVFMSLEALARMKFPFDTIDKQLIETLMILTFNSVTEKNVLVDENCDLKKLIGSGRALIRLSKEWKSNKNVNDMDRNEVVSPNVKAAYLNALSHVLRNTGDNHDWFMEYFYEKEQLTVTELVSLLETLGDLRCSLKDKELASYPVEPYQSHLNSNINNSSFNTSTVGSLLSMSKIITAEIFSNHSDDASLSGYVLTVEALANLGHKWPHISPRLQRKLVNGFLAKRWNSGSLMCLFLSSLGRLQYQWTGRNVSNERGVVIQSLGKQGPGNFEHHILRNVRNVLKANAVTNVKSWAALLRGFSSLKIPFERSSSSIVTPTTVSQSPYVSMSLQRLLLRRLLYALYSQHEYESLEIEKLLYPNIAWSKEEQERKSKDLLLDSEMLSSSAGCLAFNEYNLQMMDKNEKKVMIKLLTNIIISIENIFCLPTSIVSKSEDMDAQILSLKKEIQDKIWYQWSNSCLRLEKRKKWAPKYLVEKT